MTSVAVHLTGVVGACAAAAQRPGATLVLRGFTSSEVERTQRGCKRSRLTASSGSRSVAGPSLRYGGNQSVELYDLSTGGSSGSSVIRLPTHAAFSRLGWTAVAGDLLVFQRGDYYNTDEASAATPASSARRPPSAVVD